MIKYFLLHKGETELCVYIQSSLLYNTFLVFCQVGEKDDSERELQQCTMAVFVIREEEDPQSVQSECQALNMGLLKERHLDTAC